ncbi:MAG TPA: bifunctional phosphoribosylaminoimidazolecarboxamide formyltransferase/IMP cyclohydrolase [Dehalococcoidia bacterium]|nr:bifunctional phosphoribosylaminoimidazolecarboxamide formyltransferase/IMP cyclohydrolase [Dehalococcoidia bacterium]
MRALLAGYTPEFDDFAQGLLDLGWELTGTSGTARALSEAGKAITTVADLTGSPEMLGGRVRTLHPKIHGGILYRRGLAADEADVEEHGLPSIDLLACNLYPFEQTVTGGDVTHQDALEQIDIGGVALLRAAAKNYRDVVPLVDPADYADVLAALQGGGLDDAARRELAAKTFALTARYDAMVADYMRGEDAMLPPQLTLAMTRREELRYGENPHQQGAFYAFDAVHAPVEGIGGYEQHHGLGLSYVNIMDADAAFNLVAEFDEPAIAIIKHTNPCCFAVGDESVAKLYERALNTGDNVSAYGGIVASNRPIDMEYATALRDVRDPDGGQRMRFDIVIAPGATNDGLAHLKKKSKDLRILTAPLGEPRRRRPDFRAVRGGVLVQDADISEESTFEVVSKRQPSAEELSDLDVAWVVCKHVKSNAVVFVKDGVLVGLGAGQPNRVGSARLAGEAAGEAAQGAVAATDAFIPFPDTVEVCAEHGVTSVMHTGGSIRDEDSIEAADRLGVSLLTTGVRHFRH